MLSTRDVVRFWIPLSLTWLMMAIEGPVVASVVARLPNAELNLAAHGVAFALAMFIEAPVIHLLSTSVALARDWASFTQLRRFTRKVNAGVTAGMLLLCIPAVFEAITSTLMGLPSEVSSRMYWAIVVLVPWPAAIGYRRLYQGLLIRNGHTKVVAYGTIVRMLVVIVSAVSYSFTGLEGVIVGAFALTTGVFLEAAAVRAMCQPIIREYKARPHQDGLPLTNAEISTFWMPLAATSLIGFVVTPTLSFFMVHAPNPIASLAVLPVVDSFVFLFRSFGFSYQEVGVALIGKNFENYQAVRKVALLTVIVTTSVLGLLAVTPLIDDIYILAYGLEAKLAHYAVWPTILLIPLPSIAVAYSLYRSVLITNRQNVKVTFSTALEVGGITAVMIALVNFTELNGALAAAIAMAIGRTASTIYLKVNAGRALSSHIR
jgi:hypothetical protein